MRIPDFSLCGVLFAGSLFAENVVAAEMFQSQLDPKGRLVWASSLTNYLVSVESTTNLGTQSWLPLKSVLSTNNGGELSVALNKRSEYFRVLAADTSFNPPGMKLVPAGPFFMGDNNPLTYSDEKPAHGVFVSDFYIDQFEISNEQMSEMMQWAYNLGLVTVNSSEIVMMVNGDVQPLLQCKSIPAATAYNQVNFSNGVFFVDEGMTNHPCVGVAWYGAVAYCNWRSEREGLELCYNLTNWTCDFSRNGYRLPTEAEWEKAARGGETAQNYPWDSPGLNYLSEINTNMATYTPIGLPHPFHTTPVGYYNGTQDPPGPDTGNGYGLYDVAGNAREWCWDWYAAAWYSDPGATLDDPTGPIAGDIIVFPNGTSGPTRVTRGGSFDGNQKNVRCSCRGAPDQSDPNVPQWYHGLRCVRRP